AQVFTAQAQVPQATYRWNFNQASLNSTNYIFPTIGDGTVPNPPGSLQSVLRAMDGGGVPANLLGANGSGVSSGTFPGIPNDRALLVPGIYGGNSYIVRTPDASYALTNWPNNGIITNFTITCWAKSEGAQGAFPRIVMFGANGQDAGSAGANCFGLLFFNNGDLQLKVHNVSNPNNGNGMSTAGQPLASAATNWAFIAVTFDATLPTGGLPESGTNTIFYFGNRTDSLLNPVLPPGTSIIYTNYYGVSPVNPGNSIAPASPDGPGFVNFSATALNGDGTPGVSNVFVAIANRYNGTGANAGGGNRAFNGRYDDIRLFANKVLTLAEVEAIRTNAPPGLFGPLTVVSQPKNTTVAEGQGAAFTVVASDAPNKTYQWYRIPKGVGTVSNLIAGATSATLETTNLTVAANDGDKYAVRIRSTDPASDNGGQGVFSVYAVAHVLPTSLYAITPGMLKFEYYDAGPGTSVDTFLGAPTANYSNNTPDLTLFLPTFDTRTVFPDNSRINYFGQISGWITPDVTTNYVFFLRGADQSDLYLSTDDTTNNLVRIAADFRNGGQLFFGPETQGAVATQDFSSPIPLVAGTRYAVVAHLKASSGQNFLQVAWRMDTGTVGGDLPTNVENLADRLKPIPGSYLSSLALPLGTVSITQQPTASPSSTVKAHATVTFNIGVTAVTNTGSGPLVIQWRKNGTNIAGATGASYTTPYLTSADSGSQYTAVVSLPGVQTTSSPVTLTVNADDAPPTLASATPDDSMYSVTLRFSEPVDPLTALNPANYSIPGLNVLAASFVATTNHVDHPQDDAVRLRTSRQADNTRYTVTVTGVKDTAANTIAAGNAAGFTSHGFAPGFGKFEYFENQTYNASFIPVDNLTVNDFIMTSPKFLNNEPDTIVYPRSLEMTPQGQAVFRSGTTGIGSLPPGLFATRMSAILTPTNTANYVFYLATDDTGVLWLSPDDNPANKRAIAYSVYDANNTGNIRLWSNASSAVDTNTLATLVTIPGVSFWPEVDGNLVPIITLTNGGRYYLEVEHRETAGFGSVNTVNWDGGTGVAPADGSVTVLTGDLIGWHFPQPQITAFAQSGGNVTIAWTNGFGRISLGAAPWPGVVAPSTFGIVPSFPTPSLQTTPTLNPQAWTTLTNGSPVTLPATAPSQFFRIGQ
ncbi:MAG: hypothetical protein H7Y43_12425, partial [Akkermansiaceae bacterium]|nr:hypothetical protein [Verrucomicrobiales bacterium]